MSNTAVLSAAKTIIGASYANTYVYPTDYSSLTDKPSLPFIVIEEIPGAENMASFISEGASCIWDSWSFGIFAIVAWDSQLWPGEDDAAAKVLAYAVRDAISALLKTNRTLNSTIKDMGDGESLFIHMITPMQWNQQAAFGVFFEVPVRTE